MPSILSRLATVGLGMGMAVGLYVGPSLAMSNIFDDTISTCTRPNCSSLRIPASVSAFRGQGNSTLPWTTAAFAFPGECVRLDVISQTDDLEMVVVSPDGTVYRNDDRPGDLRPLVNIASAPSQGWYTVQLARHNGLPVDANFVLLYGRYNPGNPNCNGATVPSLTLQNTAEDDGASKPDTGIQTPRPGAPGAAE